MLVHVIERRSESGYPGAAGGREQTTRTMYVSGSMSAATGPVERWDLQRSRKNQAAPDASVHVHAVEASRQSDWPWQP